MFITADQLLAHAIGDYILQSDWMAQNKTKRDFPAAVHALVYSLCFLPFAWGAHSYGWAVILLTHFFIDRYRLARYVVWAKNWMGAWQKVHVTKEEDRFNERAPYDVWDAPNLPFKFCSKTGYDDNAPIWLAVWLLIIADNILHVVINGLALRYL